MTPAGGDALRVLLLQIVATLVVARALSVVARRLGQPGVIGEIAGGIVLGPTILGRLSPSAFHALFPLSSLAALKLLAEVGVALFMFRVGLDLDLKALREQTRRAIVISQASIAVPFILGVLAALALYGSFAPVGTPLTAFALFIGIAMAITAFPVLARILTERGISATPLGTLALTCAAIGDITAWSLLAAVVAMATAQSQSGVLMMIAFTVLFAAVMLGLGRKILTRFPIGEAGLAILLFASAAATEAIGIHAIFGAFLAGVIVPLTPEQRRETTGHLSFATHALLPLFFAYVGVRTELALLLDPRSFVVCLAIIAIATIGKVGGSAIAARVTGLAWRDAFSLGALMNTRGLMELIAVNVGYELGILTPSMFAILVVMALVTTIATGPMLSALRRTG
jgi:K+:H+ antiporter